MERLHCSLFLVAALTALTWASHVGPRQAGGHHGNMPRPAFSVGLTHNISFSGHDDKVIYDRIILDTTNSYDPNTGVYTVPLTGDYVVMMHTLAEYDGSLWLDLHRNDDYLVSAYAHTTAQYADASNVGVFRFNKGDSLHVLGKGTSVLFGLPDDVHTTLSAFLLYARDQ
ncbi:hypothetical protein ACOMHN_025148 [Nucella lapillus]